MFIGTQFSNLYTAVDTPANGRVGVLPYSLSVFWTFKNSTLSVTTSLPTLTGILSGHTSQDPCLLSILILLPPLKSLPEPKIFARAGAARQGRSRGPHCARLLAHTVARVCRGRAAHWCPRRGRQRAFCVVLLAAALHGQAPHDVCSPPPPHARAMRAPSCVHALD